MKKKNQKMPDILVIEDDREWMEIISKVLGDIHFKITQASTGHEGVGYLRKKDYTIVITDIQLPTHSGVDIIKMIRKSPKKNMPIVVVTGNVSPSIVKQLVALNVSKIFVKPFPIDELKEHVVAIVATFPEFREVVDAAVTGVLNIVDHEFEIE